jgi:hypothetical protein
MMVPPITDKLIFKGQQSHRIRTWYLKCTFYPGKKPDRMPSTDLQCDCVVTGRQGRACCDEQTLQHELPSRGFHLLRPRLTPLPPLRVCSIALMSGPGPAWVGWSSLFAAASSQDKLHARCQVGPFDISTGLAGSPFLRKGAWTTTTDTHTHTHTRRAACAGAATTALFAKNCSGILDKAPPASWMPGYGRVASNSQAQQR